MPVPCEKCVCLYPALAPASPASAGGPTGPGSASQPEPRAEVGRDSQVCQAHRTCAAGEGRADPRHTCRCTHT